MPQSESSVLKQTRAAEAIPEARVFHTLDALRGIAALGVVVFHMKLAFVPLTAPGGYLAVDLFFMMSGVVLSHAYESRFRAGMGTVDFMRARLIRLYPLYLIGTVLGILVTLASLFGRNIGGWDLPSLIRSAFLALFFLPNLSLQPVNELFPLNIPCWSLFFEVLVNLLFVVFWPVLASRRLIAVALLSGVLVLLAITHAGSIDQGSNGATFAVGLLRTIFGFSVGVLIARHLRQLPQRTNLGVIVILMLVATAILGGPEGKGRLIWDALCVLLLFPVLVYCGTYIDPGPRVRKFATFLGLTSYAVYVLHSPLSSVFNSVARHFAGSSGGLGAPYSGVAALTVLLAGCWILDRFIDLPVRRWLNRIIPKKYVSR